jgi:methylated-DNA-[protein]-cysteine S-methyltransferase
MKFSFCDSAQGPLLIAIDRDGLRHVEFMQGAPRDPTGVAAG